jgi:hypothetical protein
MPTTYHKPTREEEKERIEFTASLLSSGNRKGEIKRQLKARYGVSARTCERYLSRARPLVRASLGVSLEEVRLQSYSFWSSIIRDSTAPLRFKMRARKRLDKLLGLTTYMRTPAREPREAEELADLLRRALKDEKGRELLARLTECLGGIEPAEEEAPAAGERPACPRRPITRAKAS